MKLPSLIWILLREVSVDKRGREARIAAISRELRALVREGAIELSPGTTIVSLADEVYEDLWGETEVWEEPSWPTSTSSTLRPLPATAGDPRCRSTVAPRSGG